MPEELQQPALRPMIRKKAVLEITGKSENALDAAIAKGLFPAPVRIGLRSIAFFADEVAQWQQNCAAERDAKREREEHERAEREANRATRAGRNT
jgi:prophage regulatory protein